MILVDRSRHLLGLQKCPRARWYQYHHARTGLVSPGQAVPALLGTSIHQVLAEVLQGNPRQQAIDRAKAALELQLNSHGTQLMVYQLDEQLALLEGLSIAWTEIVLPGLQRQGLEFLAVEKDYTYEESGITIMSRPDFITRSEHGTCIIHDFKSVGVADAKWASQYRQSLQLMIARRAFEQSTGLQVNGFRIHGLVKGYARPAWDPTTSSYGGRKEIGSVLCYAYKSEGQPPLLSDDWQPKLFQWRGGKRKKLPSSYSKSPTKFYPGGVGKWVEHLSVNHPTEIRELVPTTNYFSIDTDLEDSAIQSLIAYEKEWAGKLDAVNSGESLDLHIPRSYNCDDFYGGPCQFKMPCLAGVPDPALMPRIPHHKMEMDHLAGVVQP